MKSENELPGVGIVAVIDAKAQVTAAQFRVETGVFGDGEEIHRLHINPEGFHVYLTGDFLRQGITDLQTFHPEIRSILDVIVANLRIRREI